jgi:hypothetical protein
VAGFRITARVGHKVERAEAETLDAALDEVERRARALAGTSLREPVKMVQREIQPVAQVAARLELRGPGARGGLDVRGDGSVEAWTGGWSKSVVSPAKGETVYAALRRALGAGKTSVGP